VRKYIALIVGLAMAIGGAWFVFFFFFLAAKVPLLLLAGAGFIAMIGCYLVWETLKEWKGS
jgi:predicted tellurium resistance membrane protein TerC